MLPPSLNSVGTLNIGGVNGQPAATPGTLNASSVVFGAPTGLIVFNHTASNYVFAPSISGQGSVTVDAGTTILTANNTYTGATTISGGTLALAGSGSIALSSRVTDNATFDISGTSSGASIVTLSGAGSVALGGQTLILSNASGTFSGVIADGGIGGGTGGKLAQTAGTETLTGANTYAGGTSLSGGTLTIGNNSALGTGTLAIAPGTTLSFLSAGNFTIANNITISGDPTFTTPSGTTQTVSGVIANGGTAGALNMNGGGTLVLLAANTYTGPTNVNAGTLDVTGSIASSSLTTVASGASLIGNGTVGSIQINSGGTFAPGTAGGARHLDDDFRQSRVPVGCDLSGQS